MQLPDETVTYDYKALLTPLVEAWSPLSELQTHNYLPETELAALKPHLEEVLQQISKERTMKVVPAVLKPLDSGFIDLPKNLAKPAS
jgi:glucose-6-phosphate isomerase